MDKVLMSVEELEKYLGKSKNSIYRTLKAKQIPFIKIGGVYRFDKNDIDALKNETKPCPNPTNNSDCGEFLKIGTPQKLCCSCRSIKDKKREREKTIARRKENR